MQLLASGPLPTGSLVWRSRAGTLALTVVSKATFTLMPGLSPAASAQAALRERDELAGHDPARWLRGPADLVPYKVRADVVVVGQAYAAGGTPVRALRVRLAAFGIDKTLDVICDRRRTLDGRVLEGAPFHKMSIGWDRAAGSVHNPAGISPSVAPDLYGTVPLPNVAWPDASHERIAPAGLGPVAAWWPDRCELLGRRGAGALPASWKDGAIPEDADDALFQVAPADQQPALLDPEGPIYLENLHPAYAQLSTKLARVSLQAEVERPGRAAEELGLAPDTIWIDTELGLCTVTWRGWVTLARLAEAGTVRVWSAIPDGAVAPPRVAAAGAAARPAFDPRETAAVDPASVARSVRALPFERGAAPASSGLSSSSLALPFAPSASLASSPAKAVASVQWDPRETAAVDPAALAPGRLPFHPAAEGAPPPVFAFERSGGPAPGARTYDPRETAAVDPAVAAAALAAFPFAARGPAPRDVGVPPAEPRSGALPAVAPPSVVPRAPDLLDPTTEALTAAAPEWAPFDIPPPPRIGAVASSATPEVPADEEPPPTERPGAAGGTSAPGEVAPPAWLGPAPAPVIAGEPAPEGSAASTERKADLERRCRAHELLDGLDLAGLDLAGIALEGASLMGASFVKADLSGAILRGANLMRADLTGANLTGADLSGASMVRVEATGACLAGARLVSVKVHEAVLREVDLSDAELTDARFDGATLDGSRLLRVKAAGSTWDRASLASCVIVEADLQGASFVEAQCAGADFGKGQLGKASFRSARCAETSFEEITAPGARMTEMVAPSASFRGAKLEGAQLRGAKLMKASFSEAVLRRAIADNADLSGADLGRADLGRASLRGAILHGAVLKEANLEAADLRGADLTQANATGARLGQARLDGIKKDGAEGL